MKWAQTKHTDKYVWYNRENTDPHIQNLVKGHKTTSTSRCTYNSLSTVLGINWKSMQKIIVKKQIFL